MITKKEAKELTLEVWRYLRDHPDADKSDLPQELYSKIAKFINRCPLCEIFYELLIGCDKKCPLFCCYRNGEVYDRWSSEIDEDERQQAAAEIVERVEAWEV